MADVSSRIAFVDVTALDDECQRLIEAADRNGAPNSNLIRVMGHRPDTLKGFFHIWKATFEGGTIDHRLKELVRIKVADLFACGY